MAEPTSDTDDRCASFDIGDPGFSSDPFPIYEELRARCPALHSDSYFAEYGGFTLVTRYDDVKHVVSDWQTYTSSVPGVTSIPMIIQRDYPLLPIEMDPPEHARYRRLISPVFRRPLIEAMRPRLQTLLGELLDALAAKGGGDLVAELAVPFSTGTLGEFMRLPREDQQRWAAWGKRLFSSVNDREDAKRATTEMEAYLDELISQRVSEPRDDFLTMLLDSEVDGERLTREQIRSFGMLVMASAGHETSTSAMSLALHHLAGRPDQLRELRQRPELLSTAVEEMLRYTSPVQIFCRNAREDVTLHGTTIAKGSVVAASFGSANMDPERFPAPHEVQLDREHNQHLSFGAGPHLCVGAPIARLEMELLLSEVSKRFEAITIPDEAAVVWSPRGDRRGIWELPAGLTPLDR